MGNKHPRSASAQQSAASSPLVHNQSSDGPGPIPHQNPRRHNSAIASNKSKSTNQTSPGRQRHSTPGTVVPAQSNKHDMKLDKSVTNREPGPRISLSKEILTDELADVNVSGIPMKRDLHRSVNSTTGANGGVKLRNSKLQNASALGNNVQLSRKESHPADDNTEPKFSVTEPIGEAPSTFLPSFADHDEYDVIPAIVRNQPSTDSQRSRCSRKSPSHSPSPGRKVRPPGLVLSGLEITLVRKAWTQVRQKGYNEPGNFILREIFSQKPEIKQYFVGMHSADTNDNTVNPIRRLSLMGGNHDENLTSAGINPSADEDVKDVSILNPEFRFSIQAERFTKQIDAVIDSLENLEKVEEQLIELGRRHYSHARASGGFKGRDWDAFARVLAEKTLVTGGPFHNTRNSKSTEAWIKVSLYIVNTVKKGYLRESRKARMRRRSIDVPGEATRNRLTVGPADSKIQRSGSIY